MLMANAHGKMFAATIGISIKQVFTYDNILELGDLEEAWHAILSGQRRRALTKWHARLPPDPQNPKYGDSYINNCVLWISQYLP